MRRRITGIDDGGQTTEDGLRYKPQRCDLSSVIRRLSSDADPPSVVRRPSSLLMQPEFAVDGADFRRLDQPRVRHRDRVQRALQLLQPEIEEFVELGKVRAEIVVLPDIGLQEPGMIGPPVEDVGGGQAVALELPAEVFRNSTLLRN